MEALQQLRCGVTLDGGGSSSSRLGSRTPALKHQHQQQVWCRKRGHQRRGLSGKRRLGVMALDAAQSFDYESRRMEQLEAETKLSIGIVGFGNFGQFLAKRFVKQGHTVLAHSRSDYSAVAKQLGVSYFRDADDFCEEHPEVVLLCTSILSTESVLRSLPLQRLKRSTLFVDVLSVKEFPRALFLQNLPDEFDVLCTHPMFGPESGRGSWEALPFVYDKVRVGDGVREERCNKFLSMFEREGCRMVEMTCAEHDRYAASSQFITHTLGRVLAKFKLESTPINTKGYETLLNLVQNTEGDSFDLYYGLFMYNPNATEELQRLELAFDSIKKQLFSQLHNVLRQQLFSGVEQQQQQEGGATQETPPSQPQEIPSDGAASDARSSSRGLLASLGTKENDERQQQQEQEHQVAAASR